MVEWREVIGFPGYEVSNEGQVRGSRGTYGARARPRLLKASPARNGYVRVSLRRAGKTVYRNVHALVAEAFIGPAQGRQVRHKDNDRTNPVLTNLEYGTNMDNVLDRQRQGTWGNALSEDTVRKIVIDLDAGLTQSIIAAKHGTTQTTVSSINLGKTWNHVTNRRNALLHRLSTFSLL